MELARTGIHGLAGTPLTLQDLQEAVETFENPPPVILGHSMGNSDFMPQFGRILNVELVEEGNGTDGTLVGDVEFNELAAEAFEEGLYTGWSIALARRARDNKLYIRHLALLGAVPPKIRDLKVLAAMNKKVEVEFSEDEKPDEFFFVFSDVKKEEVKVTPEELEALKKKNEELEAENASLKEKVSEKEKSFSDTQTRLQTVEAEVKKRRLAELKKAAEGKVPVPLLEEVLAFGDQAVDLDVKEFSDEKGNTRQARPAIEILTDIFRSLKKPALDEAFSFSDQAGKGKEDLSGLTGCV